MAKKKADGADEDGKAGGLGGKLKLVAMVLPTVLLVIGAVYVFVLAPSKGGSTGTGAGASASSTAGAETETDDTSNEKPGKLITVEPVTVNLANGHYLSVGLALQATVDAPEDLTGLQAKDALITQFSGRTVDELATQEARDAAKKALTKVIRNLYEKKVYMIYYTSFVMN